MAELRLNMDIPNRLAKQLLGLTKTLGIDLETLILMLITGNIDETI